MAIEIPDFIQAAATVHIAGGVATFTSQNGVGALTRAAAGDTSMVLDYPLSASNAACFVTVIGAAASTQAVTLLHTSDTSKRITTATGGALADSDYSVVFCKVSL